MLILSSDTNPVAVGRYLLCLPPPPRVNLCVFLRLPLKSEEGACFPPADFASSPCSRPSATLKLLSRLQARWWGGGMLPCSTSPGVFVPALHLLGPIPLVSQRDVSHISPSSLCWGQGSKKTPALAGGCSFGGAWSPLLQQNLARSEAEVTATLLKCHLIKRCPLGVVPSGGDLLCPIAPSSLLRYLSG